MRLFEILILITELTFLITGFISALRTLTWRMYLPFAGLVFLAPHLIFEGYRWQMLPVYGVVLLTCAVLVYRQSSTIAMGLRITGRVTALLLIVIGGVLGTLLPVPNLPEPPGPFSIGTHTYFWIDDEHLETYSDDPTEPRQLVVQIWYPAEPMSGRQPERLTDHPSELGPAIAGWVELPSFLFNHIGLVKTNSYQSAIINQIDSLYPVIIYMHGWGGWRNINQDQIEALVSEGYIVVSADHSYSALITIFPDGRIVPNNPDALPEADENPPEVFIPAREKLVTVYAEDVRFILDNLEQLNRGNLDPQISGHMDLSRVGIFGHSTGGGGGVQFCITDERCRAYYGQDAWMEPVAQEYIDQGLDVPAILVNSEVWETDRPKNRPLQEALFEHRGNIAYWASINRSQHYDFVLVPLFSPLAPMLGLKGPIDGQRVMEINQTYLIAFFNTHLKGEPSPLLEGPSAEFPEVPFEVYSAP